MYRFLPFLLLVCLLRVASELKAQPMLYLGVQGGTAVPDLQSADVAVTRETGSGRSLGLFMRYGRRPYYQLDVSWMRGQRSFLVDLGNQGVLMENMPVRRFGIGAKMGYHWLRTPYVKGRVDTGPHLGRTILTASPALGGEAWRKAQWSWQFGAGVDILYVNLDLVYQRGLGRLRSAAAPPGAPGGWKIHVLMLQAGIHL